MSSEKESFSFPPSRPIAYDGIHTKKGLSPSFSTLRSVNPIHGSIHRVTQHGLNHEKKILLSFSGTLTLLYETRIEALEDFRIFHSFLNSLLLITSGCAEK